jgi:hypothetical protein
MTSSSSTSSKMRKWFIVLLDTGMKDTHWIFGETMRELLKP